MDEALTEYLNSLRVGEAQTHRGLTIFPLTGGTRPFGGCLLLDEALRIGAVEVLESDPEGSVPEVRVVNRSDRPVLMLDGEELVGARQNRVLNASVLVPPKSECVVGVSCVEAGRWEESSAGFSVSGARYHPSGRRMNWSEIALFAAMGREPAPDQSRVWRGVDDLLLWAGAKSETSAMTEAYSALDGPLGGYARAFRAVEGQVGLAFAVGGELVGLDSFDSPETLSRLMPRLLRSYAMDAVPADGHAKPPDSRAVMELIFEAGASELDAIPSAGMGRLLCSTTCRTVGQALIAETSVLHLSIFARPDAASRKCGIGMSGPSARRSLRQQGGAEK